MFTNSLAPITVIKGVSIDIDKQYRPSSKNFAEIDTQKPRLVIQQKQ